MIHHKKYWLRAVEESDLGWMKELRNDETTWSNLGHVVLLNDAMQRQWFERLTSRDDAHYFVFGQEQESLGIVRVTDVDRINRSMCVGGDILAAHRGKGHAKAMYELIFQLGFDVWNMHRLWLFVLASNAVGMHVYEKMGFRVEGKQREAIFRAGEYVDYVMMSILESEYRKRQG